MVVRVLNAVTLLRELLIPLSQLPLHALELTLELARVVAHAREEAERLRVNLLWGTHADGVTLGEDHPLDKREETP